MTPSPSSLTPGLGRNGFTLRQRLVVLIGLPLTGLLLSIAAACPQRASDHKVDAREATAETAPLAGFGPRDPNRPEPYSGTRSPTYRRLGLWPNAQEKFAEADAARAGGL